MTADLIDIGIRTDPDEDIRGLAGGNAGVVARPVDVEEDEGRGGERADAVGNGSHPHRLLADFRRRSDSGHTEALEIGPIDRNRLRPRQRLDFSFHQIPWSKGAGPQIRTDEKDGRHLAGRHSPIRKPDHNGNGLCHAADRKRAIALSEVQLRGILEAFGSFRHDPEIGGRMIDHRRYHAPETQVEPHLDRDQNDRKDDPNHGGNETQPIVKQISKCEDKGEWHAVRSNSSQYKAQDGLRARAMPAVAAFSRMSSMPRPIAAAMAQLESRVSANTVVALAVADSSALSSAYCSQTANP